jgi:hypothetical protein
MARRRKARIGKGAHRNRYEVGSNAELPIDGRATMRTKMRGDRLAAVAGSHELRLITNNRGDLASREARLKAKGAAGAFLAGIAMANRDPDGLALAGQAKLATYA